MDTSTTDAYLDRIGATRRSSLHELHERHLGAVPFENLSIYLGEVITLTDEWLVDKIVRRRRGGFCYELNGAFAALLTSLGHPVELLSAKVFAEDGVYGPPFDHLALRVGDLLVDVGFGRFSLWPLDLLSRAGQVDSAGVFRLVDAPGGDVDVLHDGVVQYRLELRPRALEEFRATCWYQQTWPGSPFRRGARCSIATPGGRVTVAGNRLIVTEGDVRREEELDDDGVLAAYAEYFGIVLDRVPRLSG
ncbi:arylamine N-acetyltransferase [Actinosynnema sp. NPDC047251]|uniref:N-hydroxyarylamine O-acetyltransferase n=1 Tax=Saccharothrix espanaensis (strain ATCC 51144 / DSM 44229 / JCM 9112 / NBRC 15066 / NRRL 15764) TaxID=1179773 RepID=K0JY96_SACES|nr:arylamine N-acetyltransferase [Saccharothrix espanaensis]CCH29168.1 N-hydroxyarylamine O-acetyltransferase [Saccharothrix espanaensis DSM 44229]